MHARFYRVLGFLYAEMLKSLHVGRKLGTASSCVGRPMLQGSPFLTFHVSAYVQMDVGETVPQEFKVQGFGTIFRV